jgi:putative oxidoreductase
VKWLAHPWLSVRVDIALGLLFIIASLPKIVDPPSFAHMIYNYKIIPWSLINPMALIMPWLELICGLALVLGIWRGAARTIIAGMLLVFILAISINLIRGNPIDCGCFNVADAGKTTEERFADMRWDILRDLGMLLLVAQGWWASHQVKDDDAVDARDLAATAS